MNFTYDTKSKIWLEPFSLLLNLMFPVECIYSDWYYWQEVDKYKQNSGNTAFPSDTDDIETGSRVEGFCIPELYLSDTETDSFIPTPDYVHWSPDRDTMTVRRHMAEDGTEIPIFDIHYHTEDRRYVKLKLTEKWKKHRPRFQDAEFLHQTFLLSHRDSRYKRLFNPTGNLTGIHGPAHIYNSEGKGGRPTQQIDTSYVFIFPTLWHECAMDWLVRSRSSGWPSADLIQDIVESSCHVAPVGRGKRFDNMMELIDYMKEPLLAEKEHVNADLSDMDGTEWRISFSIAENKRSASLPLVPRHVIVLFKIIKKVYLAEVICLYHLKNILYWEVETQVESFWNERNTAKCLLHLLDRLQCCLEQHKLPHYIIPESNLFSNVEAEILDEAAKVVENVRVNIASKCISLFRRLQSLAYVLQDFNHSL